MDKNLYFSKQCRAIDKLAARTLGMSSFELMQLAGLAIFSELKAYASILVITGPGNNGGDGFIIADLAKKQGMKIRVLALKPPSELTGDAKLAADQFINNGGVIENKVDCAKYDCIVDAILGTGLSKAVTGNYAKTINWINQQNKQVLSVDIPSGLNSDTGSVAGTAVNADKTATIICHKPGLYTRLGKQLCGEIILKSLSVPSECFSGFSPAARLLDKASLHDIANARGHDSHKGQFGHVLAIGGQPDMFGAILLAGKAALTSGAGSVTVLSHPTHSALISVYCPELMTMSYYPSEPLKLTKNPDAIVVGMGLGQNGWSKDLLDFATQSNQPTVYDADALNLFAGSNIKLEKSDVITPHPLEAARLLETSIDQVQNNRIQAALDLSKKYNCIVVLKGAGSIISNGETSYICPYGSANLATAGSGDVLAGIIAGLIAQNHQPLDAACLAVTWHALSGEFSKKGLCLTASDIINDLHLYL